MAEAKLNPQVRLLLDMIAQSGQPPMESMSVAQARTAYLARRHVVQPDAPEVDSVVERSVMVDGFEVPVRHYRPAGSKAQDRLPALVYLHGGGWTIGDRDSHDVLCRSLSKAAACAVFSVDYRMGPEHRFPAAVDDTLAALHWVFENAETLLVDPLRVAVGGDSAGGNLSAVAAIAMRDKALPPLALQLLIYPATDMRMLHDSHQRNGDGYLLTRGLMHWFRDQYLADPAQADDWRASPLLADSHEGLAPAFVLTAGFDPLVDEGNDYADRLSRAGTPVEAIRFDDRDPRLHHDGPGAGRRESRGGALR